MSNFKKNFKDIVTGSGKESVEKAATKETKLIASNTDDVISKVVTNYENIAGKTKYDNIKINSMSEGELAQITSDIRCNGGSLIEIPVIKGIWMAK